MSALPPGFRSYPRELNLADHLVSRHVRAGHGAAPALVCDDATVTYAELEDQVNRTAGVLRDLGLAPGDRFVLRAQNSLDYVAALFGGIRLGAVAIPSNTQFQRREIDATLRNSDAVLVLTEEPLREPVDAVRADWPQAPPVVLMEELSERAARWSGNVPPHATSADDCAYTIYTSGSTGPPKGVEHAHRSIVAAGDPVVHAQLGLRRDDLMMVPLELASLITLDFSVFWPLHVGARGGLLSGRFDMERFFGAIARHGHTIFMGVPTMFRMLLSEPALNRHDLSSVRFALCGGERLPVETYTEVKARFGFEIYEMIGSTEGHPYIANPVGRPPRVGSLGRHLPGRDATIRGEDGAELPAGETGHLCLRSDDPALALGYRKRQPEWEAMHRDGWFYTGDLAYRDEDGYFWFVSRADEMILSRAYRISPAEVESATIEHPAVAETAAVGVPDEAIGERVCAYVVLAPGHEGSAALAEEIRDTVRSLIAHYKVPKEVRFVPALPKTMSGKLQRRVLREQALGEDAATMAPATAAHDE